MENNEGYTDSQTWEGWKDSLNIMWDNTEVVFLVSVTVSLGAVIYTWLHCPREDAQQNCYENECLEESDELLTDEAKSDQDTVSKEDHLPERVPNLPPTATELKQEIEKTLSLEDKERERELQNEQLAAIYKLMQDQREKFGDTSLDDIKTQMKFYCR